ncbi:lipid-A-disaccharide synthase N-terminal domain-containing protein [Anaeromyxobacter dehalogenans]|uniref:Lipid A biosynthesis-like protein n=1 Tax=Anaeromyxobacter dehalogenans (strain 2CP-C) TaxID=290397 RepID=Q2IEW6_ANADE|nr:lipid-A-disaccharide synthase N-terminal domain-containing protein [Anaeromyxobacter dehalogenans]ABC83124.1 Lipid A biosynthesis-like protein [Anaeromyxobacter dehalogenans 2CP-C]
MTASHLWIFAVGFTAQLLFAARMLVQWFHSEKAGKPISPVVFWQLSLLGGILFFVYGILRKDFAIVLGQLIVYFIYIRNLHLQQRWMTVSAPFRWAAYLVPVASIAYLVSSAPGNLRDILGNVEIPLWLKVWGSVGQVVFTFRFVLQWIDSESRKESVFSNGFWVVSLVGSTMILVYAVFRRDPVLFFGQAGGAVAYSRNLVLGLRTRRTPTA